VFHFFFDDTDLAGNPSAEIGVSLLGPDEVVSISALTDLLDRLADELGDRDSDTYRRHPRWPQVIELSQAALTNLLKAGEPQWEEH